MILNILLLLFLAIISNAIEQPNGQQTEEKTFEKSRQQILKGNKAFPSNGVEKADKNVAKEINRKTGKIDGILGQENGRAIQEGKSPIGIKAKKQIDPPPQFNPNLVPIEGTGAGGKIIQNDFKKKGRRHKKLQKVNGILPFDPTLVPIEGQKSVQNTHGNEINGDEQKKKTKKEKKRAKKGQGKNKKRIRIKEIENEKQSN